MERQPIMRNTSPYLANGWVQSGNYWFDPDQQVYFDPATQMYGYNGQWSQYPPQMQQQGYPQQGYPQQGYPQQGYPQQGYDPYGQQQQMSPQQAGRGYVPAPAPGGGAGGQGWINTAGMKPGTVLWGRQPGSQPGQFSAYQGPVRR